LVRYISNSLRKRAERFAEIRRLEEEARKNALLQAQEEKMEFPKIASRQDELRDIASENPDGVAEILKLWLKE